RVTLPCVHCKAPEAGHGDQGACLRAGFYGNRYAPEPVTLSEAEREALEAACLEGLVATPHGYKYRPSDGADAVTNWLAAREQALREEITADLLAKCPHVHTSDAYAEVCEDCGYWIAAARIVGGETR